MADLKKILDDIKVCTVLEISELVKMMEEEFGVSAAAPVAVAAAGGAAAPAAEEKSEFNVVLKSFGEKKVDVIKAVREVTGLGLVDAKKLVEGLGTVKEGLPKDEADKVVEALKAVGATAELV